MNNPELASRNFRTYFGELCKNTLMCNSEMSLLSGKYTLFYKQIYQTLPSVKSTGKIQSSDLDLFQETMLAVMTSTEDPTQDLRREIQKLYRDLF